MKCRYMIFGTVSSSYSAQYMNDYLDSVYTEEEVVKRINEVIRIHKNRGFEKIPEDLRDQEIWIWKMDTGRILVNVFIRISQSEYRYSICNENIL